MIGIIDAGIGNVGSIRNMFRKIGATAEVVNDADGVARAHKLVLPGVGAFDSGMARLHGSGLLPAIERRALVDRVPVLGICLGMQLMTLGSDEGRTPGLGWVQARTLAFGGDVQALLQNGRTVRLRVPHMGWNRVTTTRAHPLVAGVDADSAFYFVHSYHVQAADRDSLLLECNYGLDFAAALQQGNLMGVQFHPEKSHRHGMLVLRNFAEMPA
jgi:glutamine amidotransferase